MKCPSEPQFLYTLDQISTQSKPDQAMFNSTTQVFDAKALIVHLILQNMFTPSTF